MTTPVLIREEKDLTKFTDAINAQGRGRSNAVGEVTLTASVTETEVTFANCAEDSVVILSPKTSNAAAALGTTYYTAANGSFTLTHASNSQADRTFGFLCIG